MLCQYKERQIMQRPVKCTANNDIAVWFGSGVMCCMDYNEGHELSSCVAKSLFGLIKNYFLPEED
jgi:hypothetical protein